MTALFTLSGATEHDPAIDHWAATHTGALASLAGEWFQRLRECGPDVRELMHDGHPTVCVGGAAFAYVGLFKAHVNLGFFHGHALPDPAGLLQGTGKHMRHVKLKLDSVVDRAALQALVDAAYRDIHTRLPVLIFVYGTLKQGFPNHALNLGRRRPGRYRTAEAFPLYVVRLPYEDRAPWLVNLPGQGHRVTGEVYEIDAEALPALDVFEEVGTPTGYVRVEVELQADDGSGETVRAQTYLKPEDQLVDCLERDGPHEAYTLEMARGYWLVAPHAR